MNPRAIYPHPVLLLEDTENSLVISDLHLGFEHEIAEKGVSFRSPSLNEMVSELMSLIDSHAIKRLIILGDLKHSIGSINKREWDEVPKFLESLSSKTEVYLVPGNHDANILHLIPNQVNHMASTGMVLKDTLLVHGHTALPRRPIPVSRIIMGHSHPMYLKRSSVLNGQQVWVYIRVSKRVLLFDGEGTLDLIVLPSFNRYLYATGKRVASHSRRPISPIISKIMQNKEAIIRCLITTLDGAIVGDASALTYVLES